MDDMMLFDFRLIPHLIPYWGIFTFRLRFIDLHRIACLSLLTRFMLRWWPIFHLIISPRRASLRPSSQAHTFLHLVVIMFLILGYAFWSVGLIQLRTRMTRIAHSIMDDLISFGFPTYHTFDAILGHISILVEICRSSLICMIVPSHEIHVEPMAQFHFVLIL